MGFLASQHGQLGAIPPPPFLSMSPLESMRSGGAIPPPPSKGVSQRYSRDTLWKQGNWVGDPPLRYYLERVLRDMGGVSRTGPLKIRVFQFTMCTSWFMQPWSDYQTAKSRHHPHKINNQYPATKGVRQKESGKEVMKKVTEASETVTKKWPNMHFKNWPNSFCWPRSVAPWKPGVVRILPFPYVPTFAHHPTKNTTRWGRSFVWCVVRGPLRLCDGYWLSERTLRGPEWLRTHFYYLGFYTGHLSHRAFWQELFCVIQRLHKALSAHVSITHINCLGMNIPIAHTHTSVTQKHSFRILALRKRRICKIVVEFYCSPVSGSFNCTGLLVLLSSKRQTRLSCTVKNLVSSSFQNFQDLSGFCPRLSPIESSGLLKEQKGTDRTALTHFAWWLFHM